MTSTTPPTTNAFRLSNGDLFPQIRSDRVGGGTLNLPDALAGSWAVVLFNRGHWCPFCRTQLGDFQKHLPQLDAANIKVVSLSSDPQEEAEETVGRGLTFPVGYGIDPHAMGDTVGTYVSNGDDGHPIHVEATGFVLTPDSRVAVAVYSSSAIGRLNAADVLGLVKYSQTQS